MLPDRNDRNRPKAGNFLHIRCQCADCFTRCHKPSEIFLRQSDGGQYFRREPFAPRIHNLRRGGNGIFANLLTCQKVTERIRNEKQFFRIGESGITTLRQGVHLEQGVEIHNLDAGGFIGRIAGVLRKIAVGGTGSLLVAVGIGQPQEPTVGAHTYKIAAPGVNTYGIKADPF